MYQRIIILFFLLNQFIPVQAQVNSDDVILTIDGTPYYADEFLRVYNKNLDLVIDDTQKDLNNYLQLYIDYKLKVKEAKALKYHTTPSYIKELENYKNQLFSNFLSENKVTEALINEAYKRMQTEVNASHILIKLPVNASAEDTLKAYNTLLAVKKRIINEDVNKVFDELKKNPEFIVEDLGYFSAFKMVYPFESVAYNTPVNSVSNPFKTNFGYHLVYVHDKRPARGSITAGHIMIANSHQNAEERINDIYKRLQQGENFEALAKEFSDDKSTANNGGKIKPFKSGDLNSIVFEDAAFALKNEGDYSKPIKTNYGWHIVKLYEKQPIGSLEDLKLQIETRIKNDSRSAIINNAQLSELKDKYLTFENTKALPYFQKIVDPSYLKNQWDLPENFTNKETLFKIGDSIIYYQDFANYLLDNQKFVKPGIGLSNLVNSSYQSYLITNLQNHQKNQLELENPEFAAILNEYREGILLFALMENMIWNTAEEDSSKIKAYYNAHKNKYQWGKRISGVIASSASENAIKNVANLLAEHQPLDSIKAQVNTNENVNVMFTSGIMDLSHQNLPQAFQPTKGLSKIYKHNTSYVVVWVDEILPISQKTFEEAQDQILSDYQKQKEIDWINNLREKYTVKVNDNVLNDIKKQLKL